MLFNSFEFALFFPAVTVLYFLLPHRYRWAMLLAASCYFYMAFIPAYLLILLFTITIDYVAGRWIESAQGQRRTNLLYLSVFANGLVLCIFKYFDFLNETLRTVIEPFGVRYDIDNLALVLPIGLSFHTFQSLSYVIEVYRGHQPAERHFGIFALYVMFYPQLVAGPIERPQHLLPQFREFHWFDYSRVTDGLRTMAWGLFLKCVVADNLAPTVDTVYNNVEQYSAAALVIATVCFAFQVYCDFAGYSLIAIGSARVMGFSLMTNFRQPYLAASISEFWRRWHISLSTWFRDYVYIPLGGSHVSRARWYRNVLVVFALSGLWHGADWTFVVWGVLHGLYLVVSVWTTPVRQWFNRITALDRRPALLHALRTMVTFTLVCVAWIFFRASSLENAWHVLTHIGSLSGGPQGIELPLIGLAGVVLVVICDLLEKREPVRDVVSRQRRPLRWAFYYALVLAIMVGGRFGDREFIYFQF